MRHFLLKISGAGNRFLLADKRWFQSPPPAKWRAHSLTTAKNFEEFLALAKQPFAERRAFLSSLFTARENNKAQSEGTSPPAMDGLVVLRSLEPLRPSGPLKRSVKHDPSPSLSASDFRNSGARKNAGAQPAFACDFYNKDGSKADMCGNAACCLSSYAAEAGLPEGDFLLGAGLVSRAEGGGIALSRPKPPVRRAYVFKGEKNFLYFINTGVPHAVIECQSPPPRHRQSGSELKKKPFSNQGESASGQSKKLSAKSKQKDKAYSVFSSNQTGRLDFDKRGELKALARHLRFQNPENKKEGMNVSFFQIPTETPAGLSRKQTTRLRAVTFERGVEDFTLSCGTGALAVAFVCKWISQRQDLKEVFIDFPGGGLKVLFSNPPKLFSLVKKGW